MLIVLTFIVGVMAGSSMRSRKKSSAELSHPAVSTGAREQQGGFFAEKLPESIPENARPVLGGISLQAAFDPSTGALREDQLSGVLLALETHDLHATFTIFNTAASTPDVVESLGRAVTLSRFLERSEVPFSAWSVIARDERGANGQEIEVQFSPEGRS